ncbi:unnamed protein product [Sphagnum balticum]
MMILGIDPGLEGAFVLTDGERVVCDKMPIQDGGKNKEIDFTGVCKLLNKAAQLGVKHIYLERAMALAMGSSHAFNYGRGFGFIEIAIKLSSIPVTYVLPQQWQKEMFEGVSVDLKPKARALIAIERLYPLLVEKLPKKPKGGMHDGFVDALLIAGYGLRKTK